MKIRINNAFHKDAKNDLYFISCVVEEGKLNKGDQLVHQNLSIGEIMEIESKNNNTIVVLIRFFSNTKDLKIYSLYDKELEVIRSDNPNL